MTIAGQLEGQPAVNIPLFLLDNEFDLFTGEHKRRPVVGETALLRSSPDAT